MMVSFTINERELHFFVWGRGYLDSSGRRADGRDQLHVLRHGWETSRRRPNSESLGYREGEGRAALEAWLGVSVNPEKWRG